ncbi:MAG: DUF4115 domain-containing protein [Azovibrio sp.]|nr:DUF4115 domain-containing protein [Azovibrio sp.]
MSSLAQREAVLEAEDAALAAAPAGPTVGERLRAGREALALSRTELARQLRLGERQIEALEEGDWAALPGSTFVRGFVRNYARAVHLEPEPLLMQLEQETRLVAPALELPESTHVTMPSQGRRRSKDLLPVLAGLVLVLAALLAYFFLPDAFWLERPVAATPVSTAAKPDAPGNTAAPTPAAAPVSPSATAAPTALATGAPTPVPVPVTEPAQAQAQAQAQTQAQAQAQAQAQTQAQASPPAGEGAPAAADVATVALTFSRDSWVEVRDKDGQIIVSRLHQGGTRRDISGAAPLSLVIGNASHVKLRYKGQDVPLQPNAESDVARLTLP